MPIPLPIPDDKKLQVTHRVEAGCLGPEGHTLILGFCLQAEQQISSMYSDFIKWKVIPRMDKHDPEIEYSLMNKQLSRNQLNRYLSLFEMTVDQFETELSERVGGLIEQYTAR